MVICAERMACARVSCLIDEDDAPGLLNDDDVSPGAAPTMSAVKLCNMSVTTLSDDPNKANSDGASDAKMFSGVKKSKIALRKRTSNRKKRSSKTKRQIVQPTHDAIMQPTHDAVLHPMSTLRLMFRSSQPPGKHFVEGFAGSKRLSAAFAAIGWDITPEEIQDGPDHDLSDANVLARMYSKAKEYSEAGVKQYYHLALPCDTCCPARHPKVRSATMPHGHPKQELTSRDQSKLKKANILLRKVFALMIRLSQLLGVPTSIEQPALSVLVKTTWFRQWTAATGADRTMLDFCRYGAPHSKRTQLWCAPNILADLRRKCKCGKNHEVTLSTWNAGNAERTHGTPYPFELCAALAGVVDQRM